MGRFLLAVVFIEDEIVLFQLEFDVRIRLSQTIRINEVGNFVKKDGKLSHDEASKEDE